MNAKFDGAGDCIACPHEALEDLRLGTVEPMWLTAIEVLYLVRHIPLDCELIARNGRAYFVDFRQHPPAAK